MNEHYLKYLDAGEQYYLKHGREKDFDKKEIIAEIKGFMIEGLDERFNFVFPQLVPTVKWKYNYIVFKKKGASKNWLYQNYLTDCYFIFSV